MFNFFAVVEINDMFGIKKLVSEFNFIQEVSKIRIIKKIIRVYEKISKIFRNRVFTDSFKFDVLLFRTISERKFSLDLLKERKFECLFLLIKNFIALLIEIGTIQNYHLDNSFDYRKVDYFKT